MSEPSPSFSHGKLVVSYGPHVRTTRSTTQIMWLVNFSLLPALLWGVAVFGWQALAITLSGILGCVAAEHMTCILTKHRNTIGDGSAVCSGLLLAMTLPPGLPIWMPFVGGFLAMVLTKGLFGGLGYNIFNVALIGRAIMMATFPVDMTTQWLAPQLGTLLPVDAVTMATPLAVLKEKGLSVAMSLFDQYPEDISYTLRLFLGLRPGSIGEVSVLFVLAGAGFLLWKRIISLWIPVSVLVGLGLVALLSPAPVVHLLTGGLWLGAFFMATDYVTSPSMPKGQVVFGLGVGLLTGLIRVYGGYPEGICYAILLMNILTPALDDWFRPKKVAAVGAPS